MSSSMAEIRERNLDISELSESNKLGVAALQRSVGEVAENLDLFRMDDSSAYQRAMPGDVEDLGTVRAASQVYREDEMTALEKVQPTRASI